MLAAFVRFLTNIVALLGLIKLGEERQKREQAEADVEVLRENAKIDSKPDVDGPFSRMLLRKK